MRIRIICCLLLSIHLYAHAQLPQPGIYRVDKDNTNHLNAQHYLRSIYNIRDFFTVNLTPPAPATLKPGQKQSPRSKSSGGCT